jgi:hypothetical protein
MPVTGASIGNHIAENRESVQRDRPLPSSVGASSIIKIESEPLLDAYSQFEAYVLTFQPDCTIAKTIETALGNRPDIVRAVVDRHYNSSDVSETMTKQMEMAKALMKQIMAYK